MAIEDYIKLYSGMRYDRRKRKNKILMRKFEERAKEVKKQKRGFTLIELLIIVGIVWILAAAAIDAVVLPSNKEEQGQQQQEQPQKMRAV